MFLFLRRVGAGCIVPLLLVLLLGGMVSAAEKNPVFLGDSKDPLDIVADKLDFDQKNHVAVFSGNVVVTQAKTTLEADKLQIFFAQGSEQDLKEIVATGKKVVVKMEGKKALCRKMHYFAAGRKIVLTGDPSLDDGNNVISGEEITFFLDDERSVVKSGRQRRVKTTIFPGQHGGLGRKSQ
ncbi:MAG TPA: lipopolysaccharide transport periplasmic protein LptA [Desulfarculaceae bacterium]|nr:lipopolysaccharide transport periplasmic protein LptA [Desulfarculaceae bacterium]